MSDECSTPKSRRPRSVLKYRQQTVNRGIERASKVADTPEDPIHSRNLSAADTFEDEVRVKMPAASKERVKSPLEMQLERDHHDDTTIKEIPFEDTIYRNSDTAEAVSENSSQLAPTQKQPPNVARRSRVVRDKINAVTEKHGKDFEPERYPRILTPNSGRLSIVEESLRPSSSGSNLIASSLDSAPAASTSKLTPQKLFDEYCAYQRLYIHAKSSWFEESANLCTLSGQAEKAQTYRSKVKELHNDGINRQKAAEMWCQKFSKFNILLVLGKIEGMREEIADIIIERKQLQKKLRALKKNGQVSAK